MLFLVTLFALKKLNLPDNMRKLTKILNFSGIATIIIGLLTGGVFGIDVSLLSEANPIRKFIESVRILDTNKDIMLFLGIALLLGYIHVLFGYFINFFHKIKNKDVKIAILDVLPWIMIMLGAAGIVKFALTSVKDIFYSIGLFLMLLGAGIILLFSGRDFKNPVLRLINGLYGLYGATGIFGDILSYARLFALGIATGIIGGVINKLSSALLGNISFSSITAGISSLISIILFSAILIAGQIFNIVINTLGGFIHTMRLQFIEFFTKFFEGGGEVFKPLRLGLKYFLIKKEKTEEEKC
jgi:V/A-type H+-transporting ATPase subunit I